MAVLGLCFCARAFSSCGKWGPLFIVVHRPLTIAASLVAEHRLQTHRLSNCGSWAQLLCGMWDPPRPGLKPMSPALAGRFSTTAPPGKPSHPFYTHQCRHVNPNLPIHQSPTPTPPPLSPLGVHKFVLYFCVSISAPQTGSSVPFSGFHIYALIYDICFSLSDLLHSV